MHSLPRLCSKHRRYGTLATKVYAEYSANSVQNLWSLSIGDGFFLLAMIFGRMFDHSYPACAFFSLSCFEVEINSRTLIPLLMPGPIHSGSACRDDCGQMFPDKLHVSSFPDRFPHYAWTAA